MSALPHSMILEKLQKALHSGNITAVVPQDLEAVAHNTLWDETSAEELTLLKLLPNATAKQIEHKYARVVSYGRRRGYGFFNERSLPTSSAMTTEQVTVNVKLLGEMSETYLLAAMEETIEALGTRGVQNQERVALRLSVLEKKNRAMYLSDDSTTRGTLRFKGLLQQIREGTDGTVGTSPYGSHVIDMLGLPMTIDTLRDRLGKSITLFGRFTTLIMDPFVRGDFEGTLDAAHKLELPVAASPLVIGQNVGGIRTQGGVCYFNTDNGLTPMYSRPQYSTDVEDEAPSTRPTMAAPVAQADNSSGDTVDSLFDAASAGNLYWIVTEVVNDLEGIGTRAPASGYTAVAATQEVKHVATPGNPLAEAFRVYRGDDGDDGVPWFVFEVKIPTTSGAAVTFYDNNLYRPNTSIAFGLNIASRSFQDVNDGTLDGYSRAKAKSAAYLTENDSPRNTVAAVTLGPTMGMMQLAAILATVDRPLLYSACALEMRNALQNVAFINIGRR